MTHCSKCGVAKTPKNCSRMASAPDGYQTHCKACKSAYGREWRERNRAEHLRRIERWRAANRERHREHQRRSQARNPDRDRLKSARRRARQAAVFVEDVHPLVVLERDDGVCGVCGGDVDPFDFHVDHIVPLDRGGWGIHLDGPTCS